MIMSGNLCIGLATLPYKYYLSASFIKKYGERIAQKLGFTVLGYTIQFYGSKDRFTVVLLLAESHLSLESWPERQLLELTLASCRKFNKKTFKKALIFNPIICQVLKKTKKGWK